MTPVKRAWYVANRAKITARIKVNRFKRVYGISMHTFHWFVAFQDNKCRICKLPGDQNLHGQLYPDHDHKTGFVRGLLCHRCNVALGAMGDDPDRLERAARYLRVFALTTALVEDTVHEPFTGLVMEGNDANVHQRKDTP